MKTLLLTTTLALAAQGAAANEFEPQIRQYLTEKIMSWAADPVLVDAIVAQNARTGGLSEDQIVDLDNAWRAEVGKTATPTITPIVSNPAAEFLRGRVKASAGAIQEVFIVDMRGLNVAASGVTSNYWQGDESKFEKTFLVGADAVFIDEVHFDESTQSYLAQVSLTLVDPETGAPIGAMTVGLNAESLF